MSGSKRPGEKIVVACITDKRRERQLVVAVRATLKLTEINRMVFFGG